MTKAPTLTALALLALSGCEPLGASTGTLIESLTVSHGEVIVKHSLTATLTLTEEAGDDLTITWTATGGGISAGDEVVDWTAPLAADIYELTATVEDAKGNTDEMSIDVEALGFVVDTSVEEIGKVEGQKQKNWPLNGVAFSSADKGWIVGGDEGVNVPFILSYTNGVWTDVTQDASGHLNDVAVLADDNVWSAGSAGLTYHFNGTKWVSGYQNGSCIHGMAFANADVGWVTPAHGQVGMRTYNGGNVTDWSEVSTEVNMGLDGVSATNDSNGFAVGLGGNILGYDGTAWTSQDSPVTKDLYDVHMISDDEAWAVGKGGTAVHFDGTSWAVVETPTEEHLHGVYGLKSNRVWAVGDSGTIIFFNGTEWIEIDSPVGKDLRSVYQVNSSSAWIVGGNGTVLRTD